MRTFELSILGTLIVSVLIVPAACGESSLDDSPSDAATFPADTSVDAGPDTAELCGGFECGDNARCISGPAGEACRCLDGYAGSPYEGCEEKTARDCQSREDCPKGSLCIDKSCRCDPFWELEGDGTCSRRPPPDPADRSADAVCEQWKRRDGELAQFIWADAPDERCEPGRLSAKVQRRSLLHANLFRWLVGVAPMTTRQEYITKAQACATTLAAEDAGLTHDLPSDYACFTEDAADGAASSNITVSIRHPAPTVGGYIQDRGTPSLGHRRWIFAPSVGATGFGHRKRYGCMWVIDDSGPDDRRDIFYPAAGPFPEGALLGPWSYMSTGLQVEEASVRITEVDSGESVEVSDVTKAMGEAGRVQTLKWRVPYARTGVEYKIHISGLGRPGQPGPASKTYRTTLVDCDGQ